MESGQTDREKRKSQRAGEWRARVQRRKNQGRRSRSRSRRVEIDGRHELRRGHELKVQTEVDEATSQMRARLRRGKGDTDEPKPQRSEQQSVRQAAWGKGQMRQRQSLPA